VSSNGIPLGTINPFTTQGGFNQLSFIIQQAISKLQTATVCEVLSCTNDGGVSPFGFVSLQPLVSQVDGAGNTIPLPMLNNIPYFRLQGGANAVIIDPQVGDLGIAVFASRDLSQVKANQAQSPPGSARQYDLADGLYLGGFLNAAPTQYLQFNSDGVTLLTPQKLTLQSTGDTEITASGDADVTASGTLTLTAPSIQIGASGSSMQTLMTLAFLNYFTSTVIPALAAHEITIPAPPANSVTTSVEGA
jgi:Phage protein Gp138 N-terminal domain